MHSSVYSNLLLIVHKRKPASLTNQTLQFIFKIQFRPTFTVLESAYLSLTVNNRSFAQACSLSVNTTPLPSRVKGHVPLEIHTPCLNIVTGNEMMPLFQACSALKGFPCERVLNAKDLQKCLLWQCKNPDEMASS